ncbi:MAG: hypothetical protein ACKV22_15225 [Bryobacteraceae bacterium]
MRWTLCLTLAAAMTTLAQEPGANPAPKVPAREAAGTNQAILSDPLPLVAVTPCRIMDTRVGQGKTGAFGPPTMTGGSTRTVPIPQSACGIPDSAKAYSVNVTVVPAGPLSFLSIWPAGQTQPLVSTLNSFEGKIVANAAVVPAGTNGAINVYVTDRTDVIIDINGYFANTGSPTLPFYSVTPCRVADTRQGEGKTGLFGPPTLNGGSTREVPIPQSNCNIPATAKAYSLNVTVVPGGPLSYLTIWPTGQAQPLVSTLNSFEGKIVANAAIVPAGLNGSVTVYVTDRTDVIIDINGYFAP